ncbi:MAG: hypothetical protein KDI83_10645 [Gammaproteobacteria bacterium]|nr:hypothetical protein [Gammaproteobacteria bacterium]
MQTKRNRLAGILFLALGGLAAGSVNSATLFDNVNSLGSLSDPGLSLTGVNNDWGAQVFHTGNSTFCPNGCYLDSITLRLSTGSSQDPNVVTAPTNFNNFDLSIYSHLGATPNFISDQGSVVAAAGSISNPTGSTSNPGSGLVVWEEPNLLYTGGSGNLYQFSVATPASILLENNTSYWVRLTAHGTASLRWDYAFGSGLEYNVGNSLNSGIGTSPIVPPYALTMRIEATPAVSAVPIPGAVWLMGSALVGFVGWGRRVRV